MNQGYGFFVGKLYLIEGVRDMNSSRKHQRIRFLREGVLDDMISTLQKCDRESFRDVTLMQITLASLIQIFQANKLVLTQLERQIETFRNKDPGHCKHLKKIAYTIQVGLKNAYVGIEDERENQTAKE